MTIFLILYQAHSFKLAKTFSSNTEASIAVPNSKCESMEKVLGFIYSGKLDFDSENVGELLEIGKKLEISILRKYLLDKISSTINIENFCGFYEAAKTENMEDVKKEALKFFVK
jgi:hypothetical protein